MINSIVRTDSFPFVSVIVPTFNDDKVLSKCLYALDNQSYPKDCYEVIVVNNNPSRQLAVDMSHFKQARKDIEPQPGSYAARNKGVRLAKGEVLAFTDADCIPAQDWLYQGVEALKQHASCGILAGAIQVVCRDNVKPTAVELYDLTHAFPQQRYVNNDHYGATANIFTFKHVFETVGFFDATLQSGGDFEWGQR
ncbi:MAG: glycosyltransferase family A protein, partial [Cyanobacteria bacterium J06632_3]